MPVKLLTSGGGGVNLVPSSSIASDQTIYLPTSGTSGGTVLCTDSSGGTANGVLYLNSSKQVTSSSGLGFDSSGNLLVGNPEIITKLSVQDSTAGTTLAYFNNTSNANTIIILARMGTTGSTGNYLFVGRDAAADRIYIYGNGNIVNTNNSYGALSDQKLKENIVDASPKLDDLCKVKVRNFNLIDDENKLKQIGVVAQELEEVFPSMVDETPDYEEVTTTDEDGNEKTERVATGTTTKSVKYSVFVPMLIKAIQEQQAIIESQAQTIESLTQRIEALEYTKQGE